MTYQRKAEPPAAGLDDPRPKLIYHHRNIRLRRDRASKWGLGPMAPAEVGAVRPHPVQYDSEAACDGEDCSPHTPALRELLPPDLEPRPIPALGQQALCCFVRHRSQHAVARLGDAAVIVDVA